MIEAVVFDFDGLILETEMPVFVGWQEEFLAHGSEPLTFELWSDEIGTNRGLDLVALLRETAQQPVDEVAMHERRRARTSELVALEELRPGVESWLDEADALGLRLAVASSSLIDWVEPHLVRLGIRDRFEHLACRGDGLAAKPAPDVYVSACNAIGVAPEAALAVEDSPHGIRAAKQAGLLCVAVPHAITEELDLSEADVRLPSLAAASLRAIVAEMTT
jgi:HAD superfamily hydrolase (TIGR01509 family)